MRSSLKKRYCAILASSLLGLLVAPIPAAEPITQSQADLSSIEKKFDQVYQEAITNADPQQRAVLEKEHARWLIERETLRNDPDIYLAYTQQEIRYFAGSYDEPSGGTIFNDLNVHERALYEKGAIMEMYEPKEPSRHYIDPAGGTSVGQKTEHGFKIEKNLPPEPILIFVFGKEDTSAARSEGRSMAESHYDRAIAGQFLFAEGWDKYHDRFFTRTYVKEGMDAYEKALK